MVRSTFSKAAFIFFFLLLFAINNSFAQNYTLSDGEYMDTTIIKDTSCKDYNYYYYQVDGKYPKASSTLLKEAQAFQQKNKLQNTGDGYITFLFVIDCKGKPIPRTKVLQTDKLYNSYHFDKTLVSQLFSFFKTLDKWKAAIVQDSITVPYKAFLTFKINNGKVINIIP